MIRSSECGQLGTIGRKQARSKLRTCVGSMPENRTFLHRTYNGTTMNTYTPVMSRRGLTVLWRQHARSAARAQCRESDATYRVNLLLLFVRFRNHIRLPRLIHLHGL